MAIRKFLVEGWNHDASTTITVTMGGTEVFSGAVTTAVVDQYDGVTQPDSSTHYILSWDYNNADDTTEQEVSCSIAVTAGSATIGRVLVNSGDTNSATWPESARPLFEEINGTWYFQGYNGFPYGDGSATAMPEKKNILIDGASPTLTATTAEEGTIPRGGVDNPTFDGWHFTLESGSTMDFIQRIPDLIDAYVAP